MKKVKRRSRGRPWPNGKPYPEHVTLGLAAGTLKRIRAALADGQTRADFIREAIGRSLEA